MQAPALDHVLGGGREEGIRHRYPAVTSCAVPIHREDEGKHWELNFDIKREKVTPPHMLI
jgi:hypothetical protein